MVGPVIVSEGKVVRPSQLIASVRPTIACARPLGIAELDDERRIRRKRQPDSGGPMDC